MHEFPCDFYTHHLNLLILGYIRPEYDYVSLESLITDINIDIEVAKRSLERPTYARWRDEPYLVCFDQDLRSDGVDGADGVDGVDGVDGT